MIKLNVALKSGPSKGSKTLAGAVLEQLRKDIVTCKVLAGEKLRFDDLRKKYKVGISPLREALSKLAVEGLVTTEGQRGFRVAPISLEDFEDVTRLRWEIECVALRDAIRLGGDDWEANIVRAFHHLMLVKRVSPETDVSLSEEWEKRHRSFHEALLAGCGSARRLSIIKMLVDQSERYRHVAIAYSTNPRKDQQEHKDIMEAALARSSKAAENLLTSHYVKTVEMVRTLLK